MAESTDNFEIGINTFLENSPDPATGKRIGHPERIRNGIEEIVIADQVGLDVFGIGEHHILLTFFIFLSYYLFLISNSLP